MHQPHTEVCFFVTSIVCFEIFALCWDWFKSFWSFSFENFCSVRDFVRVSFVDFKAATCWVRLRTLCRMLFHSRCAGLFAFIRVLFAGVSNADRVLWSWAPGISPPSLLTLSSRVAKESSTVVVRSACDVYSIEVLGSAKALSGDVWASRWLVLCCWSWFSRLASRINCFVASCSCFSKVVSVCI